MREPDTTISESGEAGHHEPRFEKGLRILCPHVASLSILYTVLLIFTLVSLASVLVLPLSNPSYYPAVISLVLDGGLVILLTVLLYHCRRFNRTV